MSIRTLLIGPATRGGEGAYMNLVRSHPPADVSYTSAGGFHAGAPGVTCDVVREVALNRFVRRRAIPDMGFRALRLRDRFDLVHVHAHPVHLARRGDTPLVMSEGSSNAVYLADYLGWDDDRLDRAYRRTRRIYRALGIHDRLLAMDEVTRVYVFSAWARDINIRWGADPSKLEVLAPGFSVPDEVVREEREAFTFLFVGTDFERKGGFDVVEAFERVSAEHPEAHLLIVGSDPAEPNPDRFLHSWVSEDRRGRVLARLRELERTRVATCMTHVDAGELQRSIYPAADAFVMPTLAEGYGFTNIEAMSFGLPVISSRFGPIPEIVDDERTGLLLAAGDIDALEQAMRQLVEDRALARRMGDAGRAEFLRSHTIDAFRERLGAFYRRALESAPSR